MPHETTILIENGFLLEPSGIFDLMKSVYESTDTFAADFEECYASETALSGRLEKIKARRGVLFLVAREGNALIGYLIVLPRLPVKLRHTADLNMGVREAARERGVGSGLLSTALSRLKGEGVIEILYLNVRADNLPAIRLYEAQGFEALAELRRDIRIGPLYHDGILMRKFITGPLRVGRRVEG